MREIMEKYLKSYQAQMDRIEEHANGSQFKELETAAHRFARPPFPVFMPIRYSRQPAIWRRWRMRTGRRGLDAALAHLKQLAGLLATEWSRSCPRLSWAVNGMFRA